MKARTEIIASTNAPAWRMHITPNHVIEVNKRPNLWFRFWLRFLTGIRYKEIK